MALQRAARVGRVRQDGLLLERPQRRRALTMRRTYECGHRCYTEMEQMPGQCPRCVWSEEHVRKVMRRTDSSIGCLGIVLLLLSFAAACFIDHHQVERSSTHSCPERTGP